MTWWLGPSILGVVLVGLIIGLLVSRMVLKVNNKNLLFFRSHNVSVTGVSNSGTGYRKTGQPQPIFSKSKTIEDSIVKDFSKGEISETNLGKQINPSQAKISLSPALMEIQNNSSIANKPTTSNLVNFQTDIWNSRRREFDVVGPTLLAELSEAYADMMLANNVAWLVMELGRDSQDLRESYVKLSGKIAERLQRIMPALRASLN